MVVYGLETGKSAEWMNVGGPIKGSYIVKTHGDKHTSNISSKGGMSKMDHNTIQYESKCFSDEFVVCRVF